MFMGTTFGVKRQGTGLAPHLICYRTFDKSLNPSECDLDLGSVALPQGTDSGREICG